MTRLTVRRLPADPEFLSPEGEQAWTWLRRHLDRANSFWLAFVLTADLTAQRVLRERVRANRRLHAQPLVVLQPDTPAELAALLDELEARGAAPLGCTWVAAPQVAGDEWLAAWRVFLLAMNHRRDVLRARLGGLVIVAPPAVKVVAQRESPDLWSVRDLLIELAPRPVISDRTTMPIRAGELRQGYGAAGLSYESDDAELAQEAQILLAMPVAELAGPARERISRAVHRATERGNEQLAAVLLLAQSSGYSATGDPAGALHLVQEGLTLDGSWPRTRERLLDSGVELAVAISELELARRYAAESVELTERRASPGDLEALRDFSYSLNKLGDVAQELGDVAAATYYQQAFDIAQRLADQLDTPQAHRDLFISLCKLGNATRQLGDPITAATHYQQAHDIIRRLADQLDTPQAHRDLASGLQRLGDVIRDLGDLTTAATHYQHALAIFRRLADQLDTPQTQSDLAVSLNRLGGVIRERGDLTTAATHHQHALDLARRLADQFDTPQAHRHVASSLSDLGGVTRDLGDPSTAATHYQHALHIRQRLADQVDTPQAQSDLADSLERLGDVTRDLGDPITARIHYQRALDIFRRLADQLDVPQAQSNLARSLERLGDITRDLGDPTTARTYYQQALHIARRLAEHVGTAPVLQYLRTCLVDVARTEEELGNVDAAATLRAELATVSDRLAALSDDPPPD